MDIKKILGKPLVIMLGATNQGKTMALAQIISDYKKTYYGKVWTYGIKKQITDELKTERFESLETLETIKNSFIVIDEVGRIFDLDDRKQKKMIDTTLRKISHNGNLILLSGLPTDFKKFLSAKADIFLFKGLRIADLINGSMAKETVLNYEGELKGSYVLDVPVNEILCFNGNYWVEKVAYDERFDTKKDNVSLFLERLPFCEKSVEENKPAELCEEKE